MYRKGKYTKNRGPLTKTRQFFKRRWKWYKALPRWKKIVYPSAPVLAFLIIVPVATYAYYYNYITDIDRLLNKNNTGVVLLDRNDKPFFRTGKAEHRELVRLKDIADDAEQALISAEDKDFYTHGGFSLAGYGRAIVGMATTGSIQGGGSTLTLQLAKNTLLSENQTFLRKYQELTVAVAIEQRYSKDEILEMYLNSVYYGENAFGIEDAARAYFGKKPSQLSLAESAMLMGILPSPSAYSPVSGDATFAKARQEYVLQRMVDDGKITEAEKDAALKMKLKYAKQSGIRNDAPHFTEMVLNELYEEYGEEVVERSGYQVKTTLDMRLQKIARESVSDGMANVEMQGGSNASLVAIDPKNGGIVALVGSKNYDNKKFGKVNMATTPRQPASTFKSIYYAAALADGAIAPTTVLEDKRKDFGGYTPNNYDMSFRGNVTVRQALSWSLNIPAVEVMQKYGIDRSISAAEKLGITAIDKDKNYGLSLAIGSAEVPLTQMTNAYAAFANNGVQYSRKNIESIKDKFGSTVMVADKNSKVAISPQGAYLISNILSDNQTRSRMFGTSLNVTGTDYQTKTVAVKTGTTNDFRDAWTIGYTPDIAVGVWAGNNDNTVMTSGGGGVAGPIWRQMMGQVIGTASPSFAQPSGIVKATVCTDMGTMTDVFLASNVPRTCEKKQEEKKQEKPKEVVKKCTIAGKEALSENDPNCKEDMCEITGKEDLAANDPNCKEDTDSDGDGVNDADDACPDTPTGAVVDETGCPAEDEELPGGMGAVVPRRLQPGVV